MSESQDIKLWSEGSGGHYWRKSDLLLFVGKAKNVPDASTVQALNAALLPGGSSLTSQGAASTKKFPEADLSCL